MRCLSSWNNLEVFETPSAIIYSSKHKLLTIVLVLIVAIEKKRKEKKKTRRKEGRYGRKVGWMD